MSSDHDEEGGHENSERWLLTYCDLITLLFAFFVILYSMSITNLAKFQAVAVSIRSGFGGPTIGSEGRVLMTKNMSLIGTDMSPPILRPPPPQRASGELAVNKNLTISYSKEQMANLSLEKTFQSILDLEQPQKGTIYTVIVSDQLYFDPGKAELSPVAVERLQDIAGFIRTNACPITVEGFSSRLADTNSEFKSSWELSSARAINVIHFMCESGDISPGRISMTAHGEWRPQIQSRQLSYTPGGQWQMTEPAVDAGRDNDRVIVSLRYLP